MFFGYYEDEGGIITAAEHKFNTVIFGGIDERDVWTYVNHLQEEFKEKIQKYEDIIQKRDEQIDDYRKQLEEGRKFRQRIYQYLKEQQEQMIKKERETGLLIRQLDKLQKEVEGYRSKAEAVCLSKCRKASDGKSAEVIAREVQEDAYHHVSRIIARAQDKAKRQAEDILMTARTQADIQAQIIVQTAQEEADAQAKAILCSARKQAVAREQAILKTAIEQAKIKAKLLEEKKDDPESERTKASVVVEELQE